MAVAILATAFVVLLGSQSRTLSYAAEARFNSLAPMLAAGKFAEMESGEGLLGSDEGEFGPDYPGFTWNLEVEPAQLDTFELLSELDPPLMKAKLTINWSESNFSYSLLRYGRWGE